MNKEFQTVISAITNIKQTCVTESVKCAEGGWESEVLLHTINGPNQQPPSSYSSIWGHKASLEYFAKYLAQIMVSFAYGISKDTSLVNFTKWKNFCFHNLFLVNHGQLLLVTFFFCQCSSNHLLSDWLWILKQKALYLFLYLLTYAQTV